MYDSTPDLLLIPVNLADTAKEIVGTEWGLYDAAGTKNVHEGRLEVLDWYRLTDTNDYFLINKAA